MPKNETQRIGIALNPRQQERLKDLQVRLGVQQSTLFCACVDTLSDEEILEVTRRYLEVRAQDVANRVRTKHARKLEATPQDR